MAIKIKTGNKVNTKVILTGEGVPYDLKVKLPSKSGRLALVEDLVVLLGLSNFNLEAETLVTKVYLPWKASSDYLKISNLSILKGTYTGVGVAHFNGFKTEKDYLDAVNKGDLIYNSTDVDKVQNTGIYIIGGLHQNLNPDTLLIEETILTNCALNITGGTYEEIGLVNLSFSEENNLTSAILNIKTGQYDEVHLLPERYLEGIKSVDCKIINCTYEED